MAAIEEAWKTKWLATPAKLLYIIQGLLQHVMSPRPRFVTKVTKRIKFNTNYRRFATECQRWSAAVALTIFSLTFDVATMTICRRELSSARICCARSVELCKVVCSRICSGGFLHDWRVACFQMGFCSEEGKNVRVLEAQTV